MVNLLITMRCNRSCSYCFAKEKLYSYSTSGAVVDMSLEDVEKILQFLSKGGCNVVQIAGGEPTMHPQFEKILTMVLAKMGANILSNCMWDPKLNEFFANISPLALGFLLNIDRPKVYSPSDWKRVEENLAFLSRRGNVTLSFNIFEKKPDCDYIFDLVSKYGFKNLRLSFSMPVIFGDRKNGYLPFEDYKSTSDVVMEFVRRAESSGAKVGMDNAVPICMFTSEQLSQLILKDVISPARNFVCYPAIDIGPDLSVWRCFGTSKLFNKKMSDFSSLENMSEYYQRVSRLYQFKFFPAKECYTCNYAREEKCQGGCIGFAAAECERLGVEPKETSDTEILGEKLRLSDGITLQRYHLPQESTAVQLENGNMIEISKTIGDMLPLFDGSLTTKEVISKGMPRFTEKGGGEEEELSDLIVEMATQELMQFIRKLRENKVLCSLPNC